MRRKPCVSSFIFISPYLLTPNQNITFLGFHINNQELNIALTDYKNKSIKSMAKDMRSKKRTIKEVASLLGNLAATSLEEVQCGRLNYRHLDYSKITALKNSKGN